MLTLTRRVGERILIGDDIAITVVEVEQVYGQRRVRIGVEAPRNVLVLREELAERAEERP